MISIYLETFILALIQGISEFIPVSSTAHLILFLNCEFKLDFGNRYKFHFGSLLLLFFILGDLKIFLKIKIYFY